MKGFKAVRRLADGTYYSATTEPPFGRVYREGLAAVSPSQWLFFCDLNVSAGDLLRVMIPAPEDYPSGKYAIFTVETDPQSSPVRTVCANPFQFVTWWTDVHRGIVSLGTPTHDAPPNSYVTPALTLVKRIWVGAVTLPTQATLVEEIGRALDGERGSSPPPPPPDKFIYLPTISR